MFFFDDMRRSELGSERIANPERSPVQRNAELAAHLAEGFTEKFTGQDSEASRAAAEAIKRYAQKHQVPPKGPSRVSWLIGALGSMSVALAGCEDARGGQDILARDRDELSSDVRSLHVTSEEVESRISQDVARAERFIYNETTVPTISFSVLNQVRPNGEFDLRLAARTGGSAAKAQYIFSLIENRSNEALTRFIDESGVYLPSVKRSRLSRSLRIRVQGDIIRRLTGEMNAPEAEYFGERSVFIREVQTDLMALEGESIHARAE